MGSVYIRGTLALVYGHNLSVMCVVLIPRSKSHNDRDVSVLDHNEQVHLLILKCLFHSNTDHCMPVDSCRNRNSLSS